MEFAARIERSRHDPTMGYCWVPYDAGTAITHGRVDVVRTSPGHGTLTIEVGALFYTFVSPNYLIFIPVPSLSIRRDADNPQGDKPPGCSGKRDMFSPNRPNANRVVVRQLRAEFEGKRDRLDKKHKNNSLNHRCF